MIDTPGKALCAARRNQSLIDIFVALFLGMLVWPFPVARAMLSPAVHVAGVIAVCVIMLPVYFSVCAAAWGQTLGMRLVGLRFDLEERKQALRQAATWGAVAGILAIWYSVAPKSALGAALPERLSGTGIRITGEDLG